MARRPRVETVAHLLRHWSAPPSRWAQADASQEPPGTLDIEFKAPVAPPKKKSRPLLHRLMEVKDDTEALRIMLLKHAEEFTDYATAQDIKKG